MHRQNCQRAEGTPLRLKVHSIQFDPFARQRKLTSRYFTADINPRHFEKPMPGLEVFERLCARAPSSCYADWLTSSFSWPILTPEQEWHLFVRMNCRKSRLAKLIPPANIVLTGAQIRRIQAKTKSLEDGIEADIDTIARCNMRIIAKHLQRYPAHAITEALSAAQQSLVQSIHLFNPFLGNKFSTYLTYSIRHATSRTALAQINRRELETNLDNKTLDRETWDDTPTEMESVEEVRKLLGCLNEREQQVIRMRYGIGCERMTLSDIAKQIGVTKQRIQQNEVEAMEKLRDFTRRPQSKGKLRA